METRAAAVWNEIRAEAERQLGLEPILRQYLNRRILSHATLVDAIAYAIASSLECEDLEQATLAELGREILCAEPKLIEAATMDLEAYVLRDPSCETKLSPLIHYKGFVATQTYRIAHELWNRNRWVLARVLQARSAQVFAVDIHPGARIGRALFIDHATGVVVGETCVIDDNVSMLHDVTLGGTGKIRGDRHPKIREGVLLGAGAIVLGDVEVGVGSKVAAGSVVLEDVPPHCTVAGVPARPVGRPATELPSLEMSHGIDS
jgi:serine O-acetyltransferase